MTAKSWKGKPGKLLQRILDEAGEPISDRQAGMLGLYTDMLISHAVCEGEDKLNDLCDLALHGATMVVSREDGK